MPGFFTFRNMHLPLALALTLALTPPIAPTIPKETKVHGEILKDDYAWLRDKNDPKVIEYLKAENAYTEEKMKDTKPLQDQLYNEMKGHMIETDVSVPVKKGEYYYYNRQEAGKSYTIHARKKGSLTAPEEIIFDENAYSGKGYFSIGALSLSLDQQKIAYGIDSEGGERYTLRFKDLSKNEELPDQINKIVGDVAWGADGKTIFYITPDAVMRSSKVWRHQLGTDPKEDVLVFEEKDPKFNLILKKSKDEKAIFLRSESKETTAIYVIDANAPLTPPKLILPCEEGVKVTVENHGNEIFILTNKDAPDYKVERLIEGKICEWIPARRGITIEKMDVFNNFLALFERQCGLQQIEIIDLKTNFSRTLRFQEPTYTIAKGSNPDFCGNVLRYYYTSLVTPDSVFDYDMETTSVELKKQDKVPGFCASDYTEEYFTAKAADGTLIPISLVYKKGVTLKGLYLTAYGSYGISYPLGFSSNRLSLLDRGIGYAIAHVRGGGEGGRRWYEEGRRLSKKTTFTDFITAAEELICRGFADSKHLVIDGRSAGGLLIGAVINMRPDLFKAAIAGVPFVDVINTMLDPTIPLTIDEYEEWGNPEEKATYDYMKTYCPYDNITSKNYPSLLVTGGLNDPRVGYWEPAKLVARLRASNPAADVLLKTEMGGGHFGCSGRYDSLREDAFYYAFILKNLQN